MKLYNFFVLIFLFTAAHAGTTTRPTEDSSGPPCVDDSGGCSLSISYIDNFFGFDNLEVPYDANWGEDKVASDAKRTETPLLRVRYSSPAEGAVDVPVDKQIRVVFTKPLDMIQPEDAMVVQDSQGEPVAGTVHPNGFYLIFSPARYRQKETYTVNVSPKVRSGFRTLRRPYTFSFTTGLLREDGTWPPSEDFNPLGRGKELTLGRLPEYMLYWDNGLDDQLYWGDGVDNHITVEDPPHPSPHPSGAYLTTIIPPTTYQWLKEEKLAVVGQFDDDGWDEVAFFTKPAGEGQALALNIMDTWDTNQLDDVPVDIDVSVVDFFDAAAADFDGDGRDELALLTGKKGADGVFAIHVIEWDPDSHAYVVAKSIEWHEEESRTEDGVTLEYGKIAAGDVDGDGLAEAVIVWHNAWIRQGEAKNTYTHYLSKSYFKVYDDLITEPKELVQIEGIKPAMKWGGRYIYEPNDAEQFGNAYCHDSYVDVELGDVDGDGVKEIVFGLTEPVYWEGPYWELFLEKWYIKCSVRETLVYTDLAHDVDNEDWPRTDAYPPWPQDNTGSFDDSENAFPSYHLYPNDSESIWFEVVNTEESGYIGPKSGERKFYVKGRPMSMLLAGDLDIDARDEIILHNRIFEFDEGELKDFPKLTNEPEEIPTELINLVKKDLLKEGEPHDLAEGGPIRDVGIGDIDQDFGSDIVLLREADGTSSGRYENGRNVEPLLVFDHFDRTSSAHTENGRKPDSEFAKPFDHHRDMFEGFGNPYSDHPGQDRFVLPNIDDDSMIVEKVGHSTYLGDNVVIAVLAAPPCSAELGQNLDDCATEFEVSTSSGVEQGAYVEANAGTLFGVEVEADLNFFGLELGLSSEDELIFGVEFGYDYNQGYQTTLSLAWTLTGAKNNAVLFDTYVYDRYDYRIVVHADAERIGDLITISVPSGKRTVLASQEYYNANNGNQRDIDDSILTAVPGDLDSYPNQTKATQILGSVPGDHRVGISRAVHPPMIAGATSSSKLETEVWSSHAFKVGGYVEATSKVCGGFNVKICRGYTLGISAGYAYNHTWSEGTALSGTFAGIPAERIGGTYEAGILAYRKVITSEDENQKILIFNYYVNE